MGKITFRSIANHKISGVRDHFFYVNFDNKMQHSKFNNIICESVCMSV